MWFCINIIFLTFFALLCLIPFINIIAVSLSDNAAIISGKVFLWPIGMNVTAYKTVFQDLTMIRSFGFTVLLTVLYTVVTMTMTILCAYPLANKKLKGRTAFLLIITFTMYFSGGTIPHYLLVSGMNMLNTIWALILPGAINTFNMIVMKSFFSSIPAKDDDTKYK